MSTYELEHLRSIRTFPSLVKYLRDELDWPIESDDFEDLTFDYEPEELGLDSKIAVKIKEIKQLRPLSSKQPWGIFFVNFAPKRLPVVVLRRVLQSLVVKKRQSAKRASQRTWQQSDLLFISSYGESDDRAITFAHFAESKQMGDLPVLRVLGWDKDDTAFHLSDAHEALKDKLSWPDNEEDVDNWRQSWASAFILRHREVVDTSKKLAIELADLAINIRRRVNQVLAVEDPENGPMRKLMTAFKETLIHDLEEDDFADMYAQTVAYGLLAAAISRHVPGEGVALIADNIADMVPVTNPFLKELLGTFLTVGGRRRKLDFDELGINDIIDLLRSANLTAVLHDFGRLAQRDDPVFYFYEDFIHEYDARKRKKRGIYFTPLPVVSFIVRSLDEILRKDFDLVYGLADTTTWGEMAKRKNIKIPDGVSENDPFVQILDPATGTGTFLVEIIDLIHKTMKLKWEKEGHLPLEFDKLWNEYVPRHLLPRVYAFEIMMAPYTIAHMKIGLKLQETGYRFQSTERAKIFLTNTLEEPKDITGYFEQLAPALAHEAEAANSVKASTPATVIVGNPPYAGFSSNHGKWITKLIEVYREIDGTPLGEKKIWLKNDYVKFIRYGQFRIEMSGLGILGYITDHSYLDSPTFRGARYNLQTDFVRTHVVNLHGNTKRKEKTPDGGNDENVFDITQGTAIAIFQKLSSEMRSVCYSDLWGTRVRKYQVLNENSIFSIESAKLKPISPFFQFTPVVRETASEYSSYPTINDIFPIGSNGVQTSRDNLVIAYDHKTIADRFKWMHDPQTTAANVREQMPVKDSSFWNLKKALSEHKKDQSWKQRIQLYLYRPFDHLWLYASSHFVHRLRSKVMRHLVKKNRAICVGRAGLVITGTWDLLFCTDTICDHNLFYRGSSLNLPLYIYPDPAALAMEHVDWPEGKCGRVPNLLHSFITDLAHSLNMDFIPEGVGDKDKTFGPEDVFNYIYGLLNSPSYRTRYAEFLKVDFPRIPSPTRLGLFRELCVLGEKLTSLHLMQSDVLNKHITAFPVAGENIIKKVGEKGKSLADVKNGKGKLYINSTQYFDGVLENIWDFHIGGYQVCHKWLADRKKAGRKLSQEDIDHYQKILVAINETIKIMKQIDETIEAHGGWPIK